MGTTPFPLIFIIYAAPSEEGFSCAGASFVLPSGFRNWNCSATISEQRSVSSVRYTVRCVRYPATLTS